MSQDWAPNRPQIFVLQGELQSPSLLPWVSRYCQRLGLTCDVLRTSSQEAVFRVDGQSDLIDAFEVACLLGPIDVWVETVARQPAAAQN